MRTACGLRASLSSTATASGVPQAMRGLYSDGGLQRLYRGLILYNIKALPSAAVQFYTYHQLKQLYLAARVRNDSTSGSQ